jgi:hypothetical protein
MTQHHKTIDATAAALYALFQHFDDPTAIQIRRLQTISYLIAYFMLLLIPFTFCKLQNIFSGNLYVLRSMFIVTCKG